MMVCFLVLFILSKELSMDVSMSCEIEFKDIYIYIVIRHKVGLSMD